LRMFLFLIASPMYTQRLETESLIS
jgi:hypothetical protein